MGLYGCGNGGRPVVCLVWRPQLNAIFFVSVFDKRDAMSTGLELESKYDRPYKTGHFLCRLKDTVGFRSVDPFLWLSKQCRKLSWADDLHPFNCIEDRQIGIPGD